MSETEIKWPREIFAAEREEFDHSGLHVYSEHATVPRWEGDEEREKEFHRYVDGDIFDSQKRYYEEMLDRARAQTPDAVTQLFNDAWAEANKAMVKYPQPNYVISKVAEEAGEVVKDAIHCAEGRTDPHYVVEEIKQAIAMLLRLFVEGDQVHGLPSLMDHLGTDA